MNEHRNNSLNSTVIFLCFAIIATLALVITTENPLPESAVAAGPALTQ